MALFRRIRFKKAASKDLEHKLSGLQKENDALRKLLAEMSAEAADEGHLRGRNDTPLEITVPTLTTPDSPSTSPSRVSMPVSDSDSSLTCSLSSITHCDFGYQFDKAREIPTTDSFIMAMAESRQDSFALPREHNDDICSRNRSPSSSKSQCSLHESADVNATVDSSPRATSLFRKNQKRNTLNTKSHTFQLRPKSIVHKWNRYADMENDGYEVAPRHQTKLAKTRQKILKATDIANDAPVKKKSNNVRCSQSVAKLGSSANLMDHTASNNAPGEAATGSTTAKRFTKNCVQNQPMVLAPMDESSSVEVDTRQHAKQSVYSKLQSQHSAPEFETNENSDSGSCGRTQIVNQNLIKLSLAEILVQSYQPDPENSGYWVRKSRSLEENTVSKSKPRRFSSSTMEDGHTDDPKPSLNKFLAEVQSRRNEIMGNVTYRFDGKDLKIEEKDKTTDSKSPGLTRKESPRFSTVRVRQATVPANHLLVGQVKAKQQERRLNYHQQKELTPFRVQACSKVGHGRSILDEIKVKQKERTERQFEEQRRFNEEVRDQETCTLISI
eukprot:scaffold23476_cov125-Cylindrotheca_fusiformis.AAC.10